MHLSFTARMLLHEMQALPTEEKSKPTLNDSHLIKRQRYFLRAIGMLGHALFRVQRYQFLQLCSTAPHDAL